MLTIAPLIAVWLVFDFLLNVLFEAGHPLAAALADFLDDRGAEPAPLAGEPCVHYVIAIAVALLRALCDRRDRFARHRR